MVKPKWKNGSMPYGLTAFCTAAVTLSICFSACIYQSLTWFRRNFDALFLQHCLSLLRFADIDFCTDLLRSRYSSISSEIWALTGPLQCLDCFLFQTFCCWFSVVFGVHLMILDTIFIAWKIQTCGSGGVEHVSYFQY